VACPSSATRADRARRNASDCDRRRGHIYLVRFSRRSRFRIGDRGNHRGVARASGQSAARACAGLLRHRRHPARRCGHAADAQGLHHLPGECCDFDGGVGRDDCRDHDLSAGGASLGPALSAHGCKPGLAHSGDRALDRAWRRPARNRDRADDARAAFDGRHTGRARFIWIGSAGHTGRPRSGRSFRVAGNADCCGRVNRRRFGCGTHQISRRPSVRCHGRVRNPARHWPRASRLAVVDRKRRG